MKKNYSVLFLILAMVFQGACSKSKNVDDRLGSSSKERVVNLAIWSNYLTPQQIGEFETKTGIKIQISNYSSNEELLAKLQAGASGYDVAVPSDYMVFAMRQLDLLAEIDHQKITNFKDLDSRVLNKSFDPANKFSIPLDWGTTGIAINRKLFKGEIKGWKDLFQNKEITGKFTMLDDVRETLGAALKVEARSLNTTDANALAKGKQRLVELKQKLKGFTSETQPGLINGEMAVAHAYSCDALQARKKNPALVYIIPEEGGTFWIDNLVIPKGAPHLNEAAVLMNYLLEAKVQAARTENLAGAPANKAAYSYLSKDLLNDKSLFPTDATLAKLEMIEDVGDHLKEWDRIWTEVKASAD